MANIEKINEENMTAKTELKEDTMSGVTGGCWLFGAFGEHDFSMEDSYPVTMPDGTRYFFIKNKCKD